MRRVERHPTRITKLERTDARDGRLRNWLQFEIEASFSARHRLEAVWKEARRQYEGIPKVPVRTSPVPTVTNIEVPVGAVATDSIYAAAVDTLFTASPLLVARHTATKWVQHAKDMQKFTNWIAANEVGLRRAVDNTFLDNCQLGTGCYYIPYTNTVRKTKFHKVLQRGPRIISIPPENLLLPGSSRDDIHESRWVGLRFFYTPVEVRDRARTNPDWDISKSMPIAHVDHMRAGREELAGFRSGLTVKELFEYIDVYAYFDYDEDGEDEDLLITWDRASNQIVAADFNRFDRRPIEKMVYQPRAHLPYGMGVMEMIQPFQEEATELHNFKILNAMLAGAKVWLTETGNGIDESREIYPGMVLQVNDILKFKELPMSEIHPSLPAFEESGMRLAEQRVGLRGELSLMARGGSRTPATTALSLLQQTNRRFTPAFDQMRLTTAQALRQCIHRYAERAKAGDSNVFKHLNQILNEEEARNVWDVLRQPDFEEAVQIEFTATSATVSREADRQNALLLMNTQTAVHKEIAELIGHLVSGQLPAPARKMVIKMIDAKNEMFDRLLRTFDLVRDPQLFIPDLPDDLRQIDQDQTEMEQGVAEMISGLVGGPGGGGVPGIPEPPPGGPPGLLA